MAQKQKPVNEIRLGRIRAAIWANQTEHRDVWFNVTVTRLYKDGDQWKNTESFGRDDLLVVAKVADRAHSWICDQRATAAAADSNNRPRDARE